MNRHAILILSALALIFFSCKKKEAAASCSDGIHNGIETGVDCGGNCTACVQDVPAYAILTLNGKQVSMAQYSISEQSGYFRLNLINDSIELFMNIGTGTTGSGTMSQTGSSLNYKNQSYPYLKSGQYTISVNNATDHYMNGFFNAKFYYSGDTIRITSGQFNEVPY